jgi:hypothetical protein
MGGTGQRVGCCAYIGDGIMPRQVRAAWQEGDVHRCRPEIINEEVEEAQNEMEVLGEEVWAHESCL